MTTIGLVGASGVLGRHVVPRLLSAGHRLRALERPGSSGATTSPSGIERHAGDLLDADSVNPFVRGCGVVINLASALKPVRGAIDWQANDRVRAEGTQTLVRACEAAGVGRLVQLSIAFVNEDDREGAGPIAASLWLASAATMEALVARAELGTLLLRAGLFWGPGTSLQAWFNSLRTPAPARCPGRAQDWVTLVHVEDMADAVAAALGANVSGCLAVTDGTPVRWVDLAASVQAALGVGDIDFASRPALPSFRVDAPAALKRLPWRPKHLARDFARVSSLAQSP